MKNGILYGVGVGPGNPELLTLQAVRILQEADIIAVPESGDGKQTALAIAADYIVGKPILDCPTPMLRDKAKLAENYDAVAAKLIAQLQAGKTVAFLTLGDATIYSTYTYIHKRVRAQGYDARFISGIPSFCAVAAALNLPLCEGSELLHIVPASHARTEEGLSLPGNKVLMKAGRAVMQVRDKLAERGALERAAMVERCGMQGEKIYRTLTALEGETSYFSVIVVKEEQV